MSEAFAPRQRSAAGRFHSAPSSTGAGERLRIVGIALSPEYVYEIRGLGDIFPDNRRFGVVWMGERALGAAFDMEGAFNDVASRSPPARPRRT